MEVRPAVRETHLGLPGTANLRDLGGLPGRDGIVVRRGRVYRAEALAYPGAAAIHSVFDEQHGEQFRALGVDTVVDLRALLEVERVPSAWAAATGARRVVTIPLDEGGEGTDTNYVQMLLRGEMARLGPEDMAQFYRRTIDARAQAFATAVALLAEGTPTLVHCAAGKDRTGLLVALVLDLLGTPRDVVVEDYALTGVLRPHRVHDYADRFLAAGVDLERARVLFESPAQAMEAALLHVDGAYGGSERYLIEQGGLEPSRLADLRTHLLVASA